MSIYFAHDSSVQHIAGVGASSAGKVLQVQQTIKRDTASYYLSSSGTSMSYTSQIMSVSITPSNTNNKILINGFLTVCG